MTFENGGGISRPSGINGKKKFISEEMKYSTAGSGVLNAGAANAGTQEYVSLDLKLVSRLTSYHK